MKVITSISELQHELANYNHEQIALVPTMGCLHQGHLSLIHKAKRLADIVVVSIYVNPLQFNDDKDLDDYPQPFEADVKRCQEEEVDFIFHPKSLYPEHPMQIGLHVNGHVNGLGDHLCGAYRPGHFDGVLTVVNILFNIIRPDIAVFGEKDFQQLSIIRYMVSDLHMPIEIIGGETIREEDGLAKSSRNQHLDTKQRQTAAAIPQALQYVQHAIEQGNPLAQSLATGNDYLAQHNIKPDYFVLCSEHTLQPITTLNTNQPLRLFVAAMVGSTRLIDNLAIHQPHTNHKDISTCA